MKVYMCITLILQIAENKSGSGRKRRESSFKQKKRKNIDATRFQPTKKMRMETAVYTMHKRRVALKMSFKHRQETREYTDT